MFQLNSFRMQQWIPQFVEDMFFPDNCCGCNVRLVDAEEMVCKRCLLNLPETNYHLEQNNRIEEELAGRLKLEKGVSFLYFSKGSSVQQMMWNLKYQAREDLGELLGALYGGKLLDSELMRSVDLILPVPLHERKLLSRGFNQSDSLALGISKAMNIPWSNEILVRNAFTLSQTRKTRNERWENVSGKFTVKNPSALAGKHILLVDDVITTGTTMEACGASILSIPNVKLSIACIATAIHL